MRIRSTKPEFWRSARIASVSWESRLVFKGLESYVDDNGVGKDDVALIVGDVFPRDMLASPRETVARVSEAISQLHQAGLIHRYEASGTPLLCVSFWEQSQRIDKPGKGRLARPDGTMNYKESEIRESVASPPEIPAPGTGEQGNRGTGNTSRPGKPLEAFELEEPFTDSTFEVGSDDDPKFAEFWAAVPKKDGKAEARSAWANHVLGKGTYKGKRIAKVDPDVMIAGMLAYSERVRRDGTDRRHIKMAEGWINGHRWEDEQPSPPVSSLAANDPEGIWR